MPLLQIDIEARYAQFRDAMNRIERQTQSSAANMSKAFDNVKNTLASLGVAAAGGALVSVVKDAIDAADHLNDLAKQTGVAVDTLGGLGFAAGQAGGDLESIADAAGKLNKSIAGAAGRNKEFSEAFKLLGIDIKDASGELKTADQVMVELANKFEGYADGPEKVAIAQRLLGKSGAEMIAFLNDGGQAIQENIDFYKRYAGVTQETADRADAFNDSLGKISLLAGSFGRTLASELLPTLENVSGALLDSAENGNEFNKWAERAAGVVNVLAQAVPPAVTGLDYLANRASLAAGLVKAALDLSPEKGAEAWRKYGEAMKQWADDANKRSENFKNPAASTGLESSLKALENDIKSEKDLLATRNQVIQNYRNSGQFSEKQAQAAKSNAHKESIENTKRLYGEEIAALVEAKKKAKTTVEADGIQSSIDAIAKKQLLLGNAKERAPVLPSGDRGAKTAVVDLEAKAAEVNNHDLERMSEREREILADRSEFLSDYYQEDLISIKDYFAGRRAAQEEALTAQMANIDNEVANLQKLKPKDQAKKIEVDGKIEALLDKRAALQQDAGKAAIQLSIDETRAAKAFQDTLAGINAELLEQQGLLPRAAGIRFDQGNEKIKTRLETERDAATANGDTTTANARSADLEKLATLRKLVVAQAELNSAEEIGARVQSQLNETSERAVLSAKAGSVSELESLRTISDARLQAVADLQQVATALDAVAQSTGDPRMVEQAKSMQLEVDKLAASADLVRERFEDAFSGPFESALQKMIDGTASFRDVIKGLFGDIASEFTRMAAKDFTKQMLGKEGIFGGAVDFAAQMFGGESKAPKASADVASALTKAAGGFDTAAASAQVTMLGTAATGASTAMSVLTTSALPSLVAAAEAAAAALSTVSASGSSSAGGGIFGAVAGLFGSSGSGVGSSGSYAALDLLASKAGNIFADGNVVPFAKGGIPSIVTAPTYFPMKNGGTGLMGEAGPEAIMPLARDPGGELAVRMVGDRGDISLLPVTRDSSGRMAVRAAAKAYANGGVFGGTESVRRASMGNILERASTDDLSARAVAVAVPVGAAGADQTGAPTKGGDTYLTVNVTPPAGGTTASAQQWGATAARQMKRSLGRNN